MGKKSRKASGRKGPVVKDPKVEETKAARRAKIAALQAELKEEPKLEEKSEDAPKLGRPPGSKNKKSTKAEREERKHKEKLEDMADFWRGFFAIPAQGLGEHWHLKDEEAENLARHSVKVDEKFGNYFERFEKWIALGALGGCFLKVAGSRMKMTKEEALKRRAEHAKKAEFQEVPPRRGAPPRGGNGPQETSAFERGDINLEA